MIIDGIISVFSDYEKVIKHVNQDVFCKESDNSSSIGAHIRHVLDRAHCVVEGFTNKNIDYDNRRRQKALEQNPQLCVKELERILSEIRNFKGDLDETVYVSETVREDGLKVNIKSTYNRELLDIILHMVHHLATMKFILEKNGVMMDKDFGKNVSTIIHERG
jgi:hypothetical protein